MTITPENRALFEKMGLDVVRIDFPFGSTIPDGPARGQALEWIGEQVAIKKRQEDRRLR